MRHNNNQKTQCTFLGNIVHYDGSLSLSGTIPPEFLKAIDKHIEARRCTETTAPEDDLKWDVNQNMGITSSHPFATATSVMPRTFRFLVEVPGLPKFGYLIKDLEINHLNKTMACSVYETQDMESESMIHKMSSISEPVVIFAFDGCGKKLFAYKLCGLSVHSLSTRLDYSSTEVWTHKVIFKFATKENIARPQ